MNLVHTALVIVGIEHDCRAANWFTRFVQNSARDECTGGKFQHKGFRIDPGAGHDGARVLIVLIIARGDKSAMPPIQGIFSSGHTREFELAVVGSNGDFLFLTTLDACEDYTGAGERVPVCLAHDGSGNPERSRGVCRWTLVLRPRGIR